MFNEWRASLGAVVGGRRSWAVLSAVALIVAAGCGSISLSVEQPPGTRVQVYQKAKWLGFCGPDWGTSWTKLAAKTVKTGEPCEFELDAREGWFGYASTWFPRKYRACFDLSAMDVYPKTPSSMVEIRYSKEAIPPKHQDIVRLWHEGRTLDMLTHLPVDVLADVLYNLGDNFKRMLWEMKPEVQEKAAKDLKALLEAQEAPSYKEVESWLKSFLTAEQLGQVCQWVEKGVTLSDVRWVRLGGEPKHKDLPVFWRLLKSCVEMFIRQPEIRSMHVNFFDDVILRDLLVNKVETKLVNVGMLRFYAEVLTYDTTYFSERSLLAVDLVQDIGLAEIVRPTVEEEAELQRFGMTRSVKLERTERANAIRSGLPPVGLQAIQVTAIRSQVIGALLEGEVAYIVIWSNPRKMDPVRYLTTVVTTGPYGMARVWALRGADELCETTAAFDMGTAPPVTGLASWVISVLDQRGLFVRLEKPLAIVALGRRSIAPWSDMPKPPVSFVKPMEELEPPGKPGK